MTPLLDHSILEPNQSRVESIISTADEFAKYARAHPKRSREDDEDENSNAGGTELFIPNNPWDEDSDVGDDSNSDDDPSLMVMQYNPNQIRSKIRAFINSGEMKVGEFQRAIDVSAHSYTNFMKTKGVMGGSGSDTYPCAHRFFVKRERKGLKIPRKTSKTVKTAKDGKGKDLKAVAEELDVSMITLDGEESLAVPVYDTCDDIRTKINAHLRKPGVTMAGFGRVINETYRKNDPESKPVHGIQNFLEKSGPRAGATSKTFYGSYVYFEKLRLKHNKKKSEKRLEMEDRYGYKGFETDYDNRQRFIIPTSMVACEDSYGTKHVVRV
ncbi:uncharacterized protein IL334_003759 [Kwoniella shivajii]|uniref:DUF7726 domain-containing protein n=1 Tax=Kwoniella shivajii TaxID=564305 RepID=A0ABZ1CYT4_9TREE|nr:hypothetical protein IL334_003759 [Kwoniella shivajii]